VKPNELTRAIIGSAIEVHRVLGPGKPEGAYERALAHELALRGLAHEAQKPVPVVYKGVKLDCGYRLDLLVAHTVVVEVKAVEVVHPVHRAQVITYLKLGGWTIALLLNFNVAVLKEGIERLVLGLQEEGEELSAPRTAKTSSGAASALLRCNGNSSDPVAERVARQVVEAALEVHRQLGPGLLASAYEACLCYELRLRGLGFETKRCLPLIYKQTALGETDKVDLLVEGKVVVRPCAVTAIQPVHQAEMLSQLRLGGWPVGLVINFNTPRLAEGLRRVVLSRSR